MLRRITAVPVLAVIAVVFIATSVQAQIAVEPRTTASVEIPDFFGDTDLFWSGGTVGVGARLSAHQTSPIGLNLDLLCTTLALRGGDWFDVNIIKPEVGLDLRHHLFSWLAVQFRVAGGFGVAWTPTTRLPYSDNAAWGPSVRAGAAVVFRPGRLMLSAGVDYNSFIGLCRLLALSLSGGWAMGSVAPATDREADRQTEPEMRPEPLDGSAGQTTPRSAGRPSISEISIPSIFPVMRKYYAQQPIGTVLVINDSPASISDVLVTIDMPGFIDTALPSARFDTLEPGARETVDLFAIFNDTVLGITESERVPATIAVDYVVAGEPARVSEVIAVEFHDRNTFTWDDDRKVAMFVTSRDPELKVWAGNLSAAVTNQGMTAIDKHLQHAVMMHAALAGAGVAYGPDPATPYAQMSEDPFALDYVQFPLQTLTARTGDCDDLSVAYATLLEAAGQSTALLLTPGHIFVAVKLDADPRTAMNQYLMPEDLIIHDSEVWLPVEVTHIQREFVEAWSAGARQWRESSGRGEASFIPVADAWQTYPSVAFSVSRAPFTVPDLDPIVADFQRQLEQFVRREISVREARLLDRFQSEPGDYRNRNRLAVLYARYGLYDEAEEVFQAVVADTEYLPALVNLGNLSFLRGDIAGAEAYYRRALDQGSENPAALLGMARVNYQMENYSSVRQYYERLTAASGELAGRYAYLSLRGDATSRANDVATMSTTVEWEE